eukprot:Gb_25542 [translate_table: standard]
MSYAAFKMAHCPTGVENCAAGYITHSFSDFSTQLPALPSEDMEGDWSQPPPKRGVGPIPNLVITKGHVLEVYIVRVQEDDKRLNADASGTTPKRGGTMAGLSGAWLEVACHYSCFQASLEPHLAFLPNHWYDGVPTLLSFEFYTFGGFNARENAIEL